MTHMRKKVNRILLILVVLLVVLQVSTWALFGRRTLGRAVPAIVKDDAPFHRRFSHGHGREYRKRSGLREYQAELNKQGKLPEWNLIVPDSVASELGAKVVKKLGTALRDDNAHVYTEDKAPVGLRGRPWGMPQNCSKLKYRVLKNTPLFARVEVGYWVNPLNSNGGRHYLIWSLGFWIYWRPYEGWKS